MSTAISEEIAAKLREWAATNGSVASLWLFGSRAKGVHRPDSDYDIAIELKPKKGDHDWAFGNYVFECDEWKAKLKGIVKSEVSLVAFRDDLQGPFDPTEQGIKLWP
jgi:predicted nucleotidyltransferase